MRKKLYTTLLVALMPLMAQDSTKYDRSVERDIYIQKRIVEAKSKKQQVRKWVMVGTVAVASYYIGYVQGKHERKRRYPRMRPGDKDYSGHP